MKQVQNLYRTIFVDRIEKSEFGKGCTAMLRRDRFKFCVNVKN